MRTLLSRSWQGKATLPTLSPDDQRRYLLSLFEKAFEEGRAAAQADLREALGFDVAVAEALATRV